MAKQIYFDPQQATVPAAGGECKIRIKNPDTKKYFYTVELSDPNNFIVDLKPMDFIAMGDNRVVTITKKAGGGSSCKIIFKYYNAPSNPNTEFVLPDAPLGVTEATISSK